VLPARYVISFPHIPDVDYVKSISYGGQEVLGQAIDLSQGVSGEVEITVTKGAGHVEGNVSVPSKEDSTAAKDAMSGLQATLISDRARFDDAATFLSDVDQSGHFSFSGVPPGKYFAFATQALETGLWQNRDFLEQLRGEGVEVNVEINSHVQIQLALLAASEAERALAAIGQ
jgi:hypothetical protein